MKLKLAHRSNDGRDQTILEHSQAVENMTAAEAERFGCAELGRAVGRYHDCGKYARLFQRRIKGEHVKYEHSSAGAYLFYKRYKERMGRKIDSDFIAAHVIAGHHGGLPDTKNDQYSDFSSTMEGKYERRCKQENDHDDDYDFSEYRSELGEPPMLSTTVFSDGFRAQFLGRMLFSALVDADFLDTEAFMSDGKRERNAGDTLHTLKARFDEYMHCFDGNCRSELNRKRSQILSDCRSVGGSSEKGVYRLSVPTGGGKTLSSMAFALEQAIKNSQRRIIYAIPYVSIIRQTVQKFEEIFGKDNVLGHYSTADYADAADNGQGESDKPSTFELAAENWDKPIIVTTNVQFFESLYSAQTSKCRKLHNITDSVIIFDEVQMLPVGMLRPCVKAISELVRGYGCTALLCTATQPDLDSLFAKERLNITEVCSDVDELYEFFRRVHYEIRENCTDDEIIDEISKYHSALCVVNAKKTARDYYKRLLGIRGTNDGIFHLSTYLTQNDIGKFIDGEDGEMGIRQRLRDGLPCVVISTSLVEAGVDLDFPIVFREKNRLDSIIQAAGRCNREGRASADDSPVIVFSRVDGRYDDFNYTDMAIKEFGHDNIDTPDAVRCYFEKVFRVQKSDRYDKLDQNGVMTLADDRRSFHYREIEEKFVIIDDKNDRQHRVLVPTKENAELVDAVRKGETTRKLMRRLAGDFATVNIGEYNKLRDYAVTIYDGVAVLENPDGNYKNTIDNMIGIMIPDSGEGIFC